MDKAQPSELVERAARAICTLNSGGYCECVGYSLGCKVGNGEPPEIARCKMTAEAMPLTAEYQMAQAAISAIERLTPTPEPSLREALVEARDLMRELRLADGYAARTGEELRFDKAFQAINRFEKKIDFALSASPAEPEEATEAMIEAGAKIVHDAMVWAAKQGGEPLRWQNGNSLAEGRARGASREAFAAMCHAATK